MRMQMRLIDGLDLIRGPQVIKADPVEITILGGLDDLGIDL
jgi:hypothetical protein